MAGTGTLFLPKENYLTKKPLSPEMTEVLTSLWKGERVSDETIENLPEIKEGKIHIKNLGLSGKNTLKFPDREEIRKNAIEKLNNFGSIEFDDNGKVKETEPDKNGDKATAYIGEVKKEKRLDIIIGFPASGKSSVITNGLSAECKSMVIDNDEAKKAIPEFNRGWGGAAVHKESKLIEETVFKDSIQQGKNIVLPKVGSNPTKLMENYIQPAKDLGYTVNVHFVDLDANKATGRLLTRFLHEGKWQPPGLVYEDYKDNINSIEKSYETLKDYVDGYSRWDNDVPFGEKPKLMECVNLKDKYFDAFKDTLIKNNSMEEVKMNENELVERVEEQEVEEQVALTREDMTELESIKNECNEIRNDTVSLTDKVQSRIIEDRNKVQKMLIEREDPEKVQEFIKEHKEETITMTKTEFDALMKRIEDVENKPVLEKLNEEIRDGIKTGIEEVKTVIIEAKEKVLETVDECYTKMQEAVEHMQSSIRDFREKVNQATTDALETMSRVIGGAKGTFVSVKDSCIQSMAKAVVDTLSPVVEKASDYLEKTAGAKELEGKEDIERE